jgi:hypothetical protein
MGNWQMEWVPQNIVYPALLPTVETQEKLPSSISHDLSSKIRELVLTPLFPYNT